MAVPPEGIGMILIWPTSGAGPFLRSGDRALVMNIDDRVELYDDVMSRPLTVH
jgi:hypothetical protein